MIGDHCRSIESATNTNPAAAMPPNAHGHHRNGSVRRRTSNVSLICSSSSDKHVMPTMNQTRIHQIRSCCVDANIARAPTTMRMIITVRLACTRSLTSAPLSSFGRQPSAIRRWWPPATLTARRSETAPRYTFAHHSTSIADGHSGNDGGRTVRRDRRSPSDDQISMTATASRTVVPVDHREQRQIGPTLDLGLAHDVADVRGRRRRRMNRWSASC